MGTMASRWLDVQTWALRRMDTFGRDSGPAHLAVGERGEREALLGLRGQGYVIVAERWRSEKLNGDVDLIGWDGEWLCLIEVKTRVGRDPLQGAETAVDETKRRMLRQLARMYVHRFPEKLRRDVKVRFDVVSVYLNEAGAEMEVFKGAFGWA
jgi:putative endonuclease